MFGLPVSLTAQILIVGALLLGTNAVTAIKVASYVRTGYENVTLKENIRVVERQNRVEVLDKKTLEAAIAEERKRGARDLETERLTNDILRQHQSSIMEWCYLSDSELRVWNFENGYNLGDNPGVVPTSGGSLSTPPSEAGGRASGPAVAQ